VSQKQNEVRALVGLASGHGLAACEAVSCLRMRCVPRMFTIRASRRYSVGRSSDVCKY